MHFQESSRTSDELRHALHLAGWESDDIVRECGIRAWRPQCLQRLANIKAFIFCLCILSMFSGTLVAGELSCSIQFLLESTLGLLREQQTLGLFSTVDPMLGAKGSILPLRPQGQKCTTPPQQNKMNMM